MSSTSERSAAGPPSPISSRRGFTELLVPAHYGGQQADFPAILDPVRRMAHGRDVDVLAGHVVSITTTSRELAGALTLGMKVSRTAMV